jgi:hypothetical protein
MSETRCTISRSADGARRMKIYEISNKLGVRRNSILGFLDIIPRHMWKIDWDEAYRLEGIISRMNLFQIRFNCYIMRGWDIEQLDKIEKSDEFKKFVEKIHNEPPKHINCSCSIMVNGNE